MNNSKVNATSTFGNYRWTATANVTDEQKAILANLGFLWVMQRSPSSKAEKVMAGYEKRPDNFKRSDIPFSDKGVEILKRELSQPIGIDENVSIKTDSMKVEFHEIGATSQPKFAEEKSIVQRHIDAGDIAQWAHDKIGFKVTANDALENKDFLQAVKAYKTKMLQAV
jgi:hypothetical protein